MLSIGLKIRNMLFSIIIKVFDQFVINTVVVMANSVE